MSELPDVLKVPRTDRIYNAHAYLTKVPVGAIRPFIEHFTRPGDTVVDFFAGSGMTGIAAAIAGRKARLSDLSVLGQHIATGYLAEAPVNALRREAKALVARARDEIGDIYMTRRACDGAAVEMTRTIWSFTYVCPECSFEFVYFRHLDHKGKPPRGCPSCQHPFARRSWPRAKDVPVQVVVRGEDGKLTEQDVGPIDIAAIATAARDPRQEDVPSLEIGAEREMFRRCALAKHGLTETRLFFAPRNALALAELWKAIDAVADDAVADDAVATKLRFAFTAILTRASRRYQWGPKRPLNAQNQTYYIAPVYFEWNVFDLFLRKVEAAIRSDGEIFGARPLFAQGLSDRVTYEIASADALAHLEDESVDYVFTDPPFGSNIFYADMNLFHEAWLGARTDQAKEAVMHTSGKKKNGAAERYEAILRGAFAEAMRILRPGRYMSVVFGNSKGAIWARVQRALRDAGFDPVPQHVAILDKGQRSVKGLNSGSERVVTVDLVLTVRKPNGNGNGNSRTAEPATAHADELLAAAISGLDQEHANNPSYVYAATVREAIRRHQSVEQLHLGDVLIALRNAGYGIDARTGLLNQPVVAPRLLNRQAGYDLTSATPTSATSVAADPCSTSSGSRTYG